MNAILRKGNRKGIFRLKAMPIEIVKAIIVKHLDVFNADKNHKVVKNTDEMMRILDLKMLEIYVKCIVKFPDNPFPKNKGGYVWNSEVEQRYELVKIAADKAWDLSKAFPMYEMSPLINMFMTLAGESNLYMALEPMDIIRILPHKDGILHEVEDFIVQLKKQFNSKEFKQQYNASRRHVNKNYRGAVELVEGIFAIRSRVLVLRLDLSYRKDFDQPGIEHGGPKLDHFRKQGARFFRALKEKIFKKDLLGYMWALEYTKGKGLHYHTLIFLDGANRREDIVLAKMLGEFWVSKITGGTGLYFNCNAQATEYKQVGIGMIDWSDSIKRHNLLTRVVPYLTKSEYFLRHSELSKVKTFGRSKLPKHVGIKRGRKRKDPAAIGGSNVAC